MKTFMEMVDDYSNVMYNKGIMDLLVKIQISEVVDFDIFIKINNIAMDLRVKEEGLSNDK